MTLGFLAGLAEHAAVPPGAINATPPMSLVASQALVPPSVVDDMTAKVMAGWATVSADPDFVQTLATPGAMFNMQYRSDPVTGLSAQYAIGWSTETVGVTKYWSVDLATGAVTGPLATVMPNVHHTTFTSANWGGREYSSSLVFNQYMYGTLDVPTFANPPSAQQKNVDRIGSVWMGIAPASGGGNGLLQEGMDDQINTVHWTDSYTNGQSLPAYGWWLECVPASGHTGWGPQPFTYGDHSAAGDRDYFYFRFDNGLYGANTWKSEIYDTTSTLDHVIYANMNNCAGSSSSPFAPTWGQTISEALSVPSYGFPQIPQWSGSGEPVGVPTNAVTFWDVAGCNTSGSCSYERNAATLNTFDLWQNTASANTAVGMYTSGTDYDVYVQWLSSTFTCGSNGNEAC